MTSSLPSSVDLLYGFSQSSDLLTNTSSITPNTLWAKLNECDECIFLGIWRLKVLLLKILMMLILCIILFLFQLVLLEERKWSQTSTFLL
ncbi:putative FAS1 domain-containing protein [Armadillidium vulgare iridescent virus]|uniref:Putative FAS1 domain-containing protein n=1 Tax=Armadillidium vulgare iridescent virus TaxID=72201 RepID=A0A068QKH4_9VIRU|nr:putative FAS1 domain-containing protein [Armadillidium vulgare iridescent virus]CCV02466.1 putative FAS1 domain-containing protein [Armadillidium vulgare iridescent virus]